MHGMDKKNSFVIWFDDINFNEPIKSKLIEKSVRTAEPISGKIDYDIDGKIVGNWFLEGTNGYSGIEKGGRYWLGHLSLVYDSIDPTRVVLSIGNYNGEDSRQYAVKGNLPNPSEIGLDSGMIKYELVRYTTVTSDGKQWDYNSPIKNLKTESQDNVEGVALVQMLEKRKIKFEVFPGKTGSQVSGFTSSAKIYER